MSRLTAFIRGRSRKREPDKPPSKPPTSPRPQQKQSALTEKHDRGPPGYDHDFMAVWGRNLQFMREQRFLSAYRRGENGLPLSSLLRRGDPEVHIEWRAHVCRWAASHALHLPGDLVECGVNTGFLSAMICEYINFNNTDKSFWLFDTFAGIPLEQLNDAEKRLGREERNASYPDCWEIVQKNFSPFPKAYLVRGKVPDTLATVPIAQVAYLSLDMNIALPERAAIEFFWPLLVPGAMIVLDDYGWNTHESQKETLDEFARAAGVAILTLPTGQGLLIKPPHGRIH